MDLPHDATGLSEVCDCGISASNSLTFLKLCKLTEKKNIPSMFFFSKKKMKKKSTKFYVSEMHAIY